KAYPANKNQWKPADRSSTATEIAWTLVVSQFVTEPILVAPKLEPQAPPAPPTDWNALVSTFEQAHRDASKRLTSMSEDVFKSTIIMPVGPGGATAPVRR